MGQTFKNIGMVSLLTVGSRLLGLVRDVLLFALLGAGVWNSAFIVAFTLPNLFRRLLGEGALTSALIPIFTDVVAREGRGRAFAFFNQVVLRTLGLLLALTAGGSLLLLFLGGSGWLSERWALGAELSIYLLPYMIFICLAAVVSAGLQCLGRFFEAALTPVLLNLAMIAALLAALGLGLAEARTVYLLCAGVLLGGLLQLAVPGFAFLRQGWRPALRLERPESLGRLWQLFLPGLLGAAILQINILVSRLLAFSLDESAVSLLYLASRLMELPLGVFTIAIVTVYFPLLSRLAGSRDEAGFEQSYGEGFRLILALMVPAGIGLVALGEPILRLLQWGAFSPESARAALPLLAIYGLGLPFYAVATFATRGLHAQQDMRSPVRIAAVCLVSNALLGLALMPLLGAAGLALANVLSAFLQALLLWRAGRRSSFAGLGQGLLPPLAKIVAAALLMGLFCWSLRQWFFPDVFGSERSVALGAVLVLLPAGVGIYFALLYLLRFKDLPALTQLLGRRLGRRSKD